MYSHRLIEAFENVKYQSDVTIYCQNKTQVKTNKLSLFFSSKLFAKLIGNSENNQFQEYDVLCPDFDPSSMAKVIELINTGSTKVSMASEAVYKGMIDIMQCLQINIQLNEKTLLNFPTNKPPPFEVAINKTSSKPHKPETEMCQKIENRKLKKPETMNAILDPAENDNRASADNDSAFFEMEDENTKDKKSCQILPYRCQLCEKSFKLLIALQRHQIKHLTNESASFREPQQNEEHELVELEKSLTTDETIPIQIEEQENMDHCYICPCCDETFPDFYLYNLHAQTIYDGSCSSLKQNDVSKKDELDQRQVKLDPNNRELSDGCAILQEQSKGRIKQNKIAEKKFICPLCQTGKTSNGHLLAHMASNHCREDIYLHYDKSERQCKICGQQAKSYYHLVSHLVTIHNFLTQILPPYLLEKLSNARKVALKIRK